MNLDEYKRRVIELFQGPLGYGLYGDERDEPQATEEQWQAMADAVFYAARYGPDGMRAMIQCIDATVDPPEVTYGS